VGLAKGLWLDHKWTGGGLVGVWVRSAVYYTADYGGWCGDCWREPSDAIRLESERSSKRFHQR
jgi:hypothetical protein